jgi:hypothetical protein
MRTGGSHRARTGRRQAASQIERLARFSGATLTDPTVFGGGADVAAVGVRAETVAYGYLAVVEGYTHPASGAHWCTLSVTLPNAVPFLAVDHRSALAQHAVPISDAVFDGYTASTGFADFDAEFVVTAQDPLTAGRLLTPELRAVLLQRPAQRLMYSGARLLVRSFDGAEVTAEVTDWLVGVAGAVLAATPAFVSRVLTPDTGPGGRPFPRGLYGPNE